MKRGFGVSSMVFMITLIQGRVKQENPPVIDETWLWGFFDGVYDNINPRTCEARSYLFLNSSHVINFSLHLGYGSSN